MLSLEVPTLFQVNRLCPERAVLYLCHWSNTTADPTPGNQPQLETRTRPVTDLWLCGGVEVVRRANRGSSQRRLALPFLLGGRLVLGHWPASLRLLGLS